MITSAISRAALLASALFSAAALANPVTPVTDYGSLTLAASNSDSGGDFDNGLSTPGTYAYANSYGSAGMFYDSYIITVGPSQLEAITTTINLGETEIDSLELRLFSFVPGAGVAIPTTGMPASPVNSWTNVNIPAGGGTGVVNVLVDPSVASGTYVLQVLGTSGADGGSYGGSLDLAAVPLPATLPLFVAGVGALGALRRRGATRAA